jgi:hypothetical protein
LIVRYQPLDGLDNNGDESCVGCGAVVTDGTGICPDCLQFAIVQAKLPIQEIEENYNDEQDQEQQETLQS